MDYILRFPVSVMASVAGYYIRKWLDRNDKTVSPKRTPKDWPPWGFTLTMEYSPFP